MAQQAIKIDKPIVGFSIKKPQDGEGDAQAPSVADVDPRFSQIDRREEGVLQSETAKVKLSNSHGKQTIYLSVSYTPVEGRVDGAEVVVERPLEFFSPSLQNRGDGEWVAATMRQLSLMARAGMAVRGLRDLTHVEGGADGMTNVVLPSGKGKFCPSVVAALATYLLELLRLRGYVDQAWEVRSAEQLDQAFRRRQRGLAAVEANTEDTADGGVFGTCKECGDGQLVMMDGCLTCRDCGDSKCG